MQRGHKSSLRLEMLMNLTDIVLVTENDKGTETNMLMTVDDYKRFLDIKDLSDLSERDRFKVCVNSKN